MPSSLALAPQGSGRVAHTPLGNFFRYLAGLLAIAMFAGGCATPASDAAFRVSNVKQGLARLGPQGKGIIYSEGTTFRIATNGDCIALGKKVPCMWFAVAFDYEANSDATTLTCSTTFSEPVEVVDPDKHHGKAREFSGPVTLKGRTGRAFLPGYVTTDAEVPEPSRFTTVCLLEGREVLRASFSFQ
jgi:hypothetical protein